MLLECSLCHLRYGCTIQLTTADATFLQIILPEDFVSRVLQVKYILTLIGNTIKGLCIKRLVNEDERLDTSSIGFHQAIAPLSDCVLNSIILLLLGLRAVIVWCMLHVYIADIEDGVQVTLNHQVTFGGSLCRNPLHLDGLPSTRSDIKFLGNKLTLFILTGIHQAICKSTVNVFIRCEFCRLVIFVCSYRESDGVKTLWIEIEAFNDIYL